MVNNNNIKNRVEQVAKQEAVAYNICAFRRWILIRDVTMVKGCNRHPYFYSDWFIKRFTGSTSFANYSIRCRNLFKRRGDHFNTNFTVINWMITNRNDLEGSIDLWWIVQWQSKLLTQQLCFDWNLLKKFKWRYNVFFFFNLYKEWNLLKRWKSFVSNKSIKDPYSYDEYKHV